MKNSKRYAEFIKRTITGTILVAGLIVVYLCTPVWVLSLLFTAILCAILCFEWPAFKAPFLTPFYPILPFLALILLNEGSPRILFPLLSISVCSYDSGGYLVGKQWGYHKLCPSISPGKTWEGVIGGFSISYVFTGLFLYLNNFTLKPGILFIFLLAISISATLGDLFESYLKRRAGLKDSGTFLPGHGGWLDRMDGILGGACALYLIRPLALLLLN